MRAIAVLAIFALTWLHPMPAVADTPNCVSKTEFDRVNIGWRKKRVHRVFDTRGYRVASYTSGGSRFKQREYSGCQGNSSVAIVYRQADNGRWRVVIKSRASRPASICVDLLPFCLGRTGV